MEIIFAKQYLKDLHITGKTTEKKYRFQPDIIKRYHCCPVKVPDDYYKV